MTQCNPFKSSRRVRALATTSAALVGIALGGALFAAPAQAADLCNNTNGYGVMNNPGARLTPCVLNQSAQISQLITYHWNGGRGARPGSISLVSTSTGKTYGPFAAGGSSGQGGAPNVNWTANVNLSLPAGSYVVRDSDPSTWSWNQQSGSNGFVKVEGNYVAAPPPVVLPPPPPITKPAPVTTGMLCDNTNTGGVLNNPNSHRTPCNLKQEAHITQLISYHWNNGRGATPGTILVFNPNTGQEWGPFPTTGSSGQNGVKNVNWTANVNLYLPAANYQIIDSDPPTWSWNSATGGYGFIKVAGSYVSGIPTTPPVGAKGGTGPSNPTNPTQPTQPAPPMVTYNPCDATTYAHLELAKPVCFGPPGTTVLTLYVNYGTMTSMPTVAYFKSGQGNEPISTMLHSTALPALPGAFGAPITHISGTGFAHYDAYTLKIPPLSSGICLGISHKTVFYDLWVAQSGDVDTVGVACP